jgi:hypothetical protein
LRCTKKHKEEEEGDGNNAFFVELRCSVAPQQEEEGDGS